MGGRTAPQLAGWHRICLLSEVVEAKGLILMAAAHPDALPKAACSDLSALRAGTLAALENRLREGLDAGEIAPEADLAVMAAFYNTVQQGMVFRARDGATADELRGTARAAMLAWDGLAGLRRS